MSEMSLKVYVDTSALPTNIRHSPEEHAAAEELLEMFAMFSSHITYYEANNTKNQLCRDALIEECELLTPIPKDQRLLGFNNQILPYGGCLCSPIISDVQDETIRKELIDRGLERRDAEHITQAVCNHCDKFLTCDVKTIIKSHGQWIKERFNLMAVRPSELLQLVFEKGATPAQASRMGW
jgi:hypothetical protein